MSEITGNATVKKTKKIKKEKIENLKGTITLNEALIILKDKSEISKIGLRRAAVRDNFKSKHIGNGKEKFLLDEMQFDEWVKKTIDAIPEGFMLISKAAKTLNITSIWVYKLIDKYKIKTKTAGGGKGKIYVEFAALKAVYKKKKVGI